MNKKNLIDEFDLIDMNKKIETDSCQYLIQPI
jgi:hypothetical protein